MAGETDLSELITGMVPKLNKGEYVFCSVNDINKIERSVTIREVKEVEGTTVLERNKADELKLKYDYVAAWITLNSTFLPRSRGSNSCLFHRTSRI